jgi:hypothetical protein
VNKTAYGSAVLLVLAMMRGCLAATAGAPEYEVKAAYVYNFVKFVEWPQSDSVKSLTVCICGKSPIGGFLDEAVRGKLVHGLPIEVKRMSDGGENWDPCQVVFFGAASRASIQSILEQLKGHSVLTIGESQSFAENGGMIALVTEDGRARFDINLGAVTDGHLKVSSKLVELGRVVRSKK